jgi:hypothetical protein
MSNDTETTKLLVKDLRFDHDNPRLAEYGITPKTHEDEILKILWETMDVQELVQSIASSGFFPQEALIVVKENGKNIVIEGNRRLAAVKVMLHDRLPKGVDWTVPPLKAAALEALKSLPVVISTRENQWRYLGFKHVNGPAKWSSYAKAKYIAEVHRDYKVPLAEIAHQIGDRHNTVQRLYRGLMVLEQAEKEGVFDREDRFRPRLAFSHLYTGLDYENIASFLHISPKEAETTKPVPAKRIKELGEMLVWLYGSKKNNQPPAVESQNPDLRQLNAVVASRQSIAALRSGVELSKAFEISRPPDVVFEESLLAAKRELTTAQAHVTTGYDNSEALLRIAGTVANIADAIYSQMEAKKSPGTKKPRLSES